MACWPRMIVSGHARLPNEAVARAAFEILTVVVAADPDTSEVLEVDCTLATRPARGFVETLLLGRRLSDGPDDALSIVQAHYWGGAKRALAAALRDLYDNWNAINP